MSRQPLTRARALDAQREHWADTFAAQVAMYGTGPSEVGRAAIEAFVDEGCTRVVELGAGQGRDALALLRAGFKVEVLDYASEPLAKLASSAGPELGPRLHPLPLPNASVDACYSHMLVTMALTTPWRAGEVRHWQARWGSSKAPPDDP
ncbi:MAG: class I SAM-dependent methyltransferase [Candidatus Dormibacteria bacterium]